MYYIRTSTNISTDDGDDTNNNVTVTTFISAVRINSIQWALLVN